MNGNQAILDRAAPAETVAEPIPAPARDLSLRGPWLQVGRISRFEWNHYQLPMARLPQALDGLRILHLSDVHLKSTWHPALDALHERVQREPPDLIFITGDFVEDKYDCSRAVALAERFVTGLRSRCGVYAVTGNHDGDFIGPRVARGGVEVLPVGGMRVVSVRGETVEVIGLAGLDRKDLTLQHVLDAASRGGAGAGADAGAGAGRRVPRLVLSHYPDALVQLARHGVSPDVHFAGHTHGGQVCLPGGIPILRHDTLPRCYCSGVHRLGDAWLVVSRGMGYSSYPVRVFCPAEVVEVVLKAEG